MKCSKAKILVSASLDGELSRRDQRILERHLTACVECAREKAEFSGVRDVMPLWADVEPSPHLAESFSRKLQELRQEQNAARVRPRWVFGTVAAGAAATLVMAGFLLHAVFVHQPVTPTSPQYNVVLPAPPESNPGELQEQNTPITDSQTVAGNKPPAGNEDSTRNESNAPSRGTDVTVPSNPNIAVNPPSQVVRQNSRDRGGRVQRNNDLANRHAIHVETADVDEMRTAMAGVVEGEAVSKVANNLGEASLAMNESVERVRGTLQRAMDVMASSTLPVDGSNRDYDGGSIL